jgi:glucose-1-phosphate thymidylyltransferase
MKGVVLAGGSGTRMKPATSVTNKHLLPIYSRDGAVPMISYPIRTLVSSGADEILIVSSREHSGSIIQNLGDGSEFGADFTYRIQDPSRTGKGIASALILSESFTSEEPFAVILGDNFYEDSFGDEFSRFKSSSTKATLFTKEVDDPSRFGVYQDGSIEEKPKNPTSNLAVTGLYLYKSGVYELAKTLKPSARGELEISEINNFYCSSGEVEILETKGFWSDMGTPESALRTQEFLAGL